MHGWASCRSRCRSSRSSSRRSPARPRGCCCCRPAPASSTSGSATSSAGSGSSSSTGPLNIYSFFGLLLVYTVYQVPYAFMLITAGLRNVDPALEEASRVSGAGLLRTLRAVTLPAVMPSIAGAVLLMAWSGFGLVSIPLVIGTGREHPRPLRADRPGAGRTSRPTRASPSA